MVDQFRSEAVFRLESARAAQQADAQAWQTFNTIATGLATALTTALVVAASAPSAVGPAPLAPSTTCLARPSRNTITGQVMSVAVTCR